MNKLIILILILFLLNIFLYFKKRSMFEHTTEFLPGETIPDKVIIFNNLIRKYNKNNIQLPIKSNNTNNIDGNIVFSKSVDRSKLGNPTFIGYMTKELELTTDKSLLTNNDILNIVSDLKDYKLSIIQNISNKNIIKNAGIRIILIGNKQNDSKNIYLVNTFLVKKNSELFEPISREDIIWEYDKCPKNKNKNCKQLGYLRENFYTVDKAEFKSEKDNYVFTQISNNNGFNKSDTSDGYKKINFISKYAKDNEFTAYNDKKLSEYLYLRSNENNNNYSGTPLWKGMTQL